MDNWFKSRWFVRAISLAFTALLFIYVNFEVNKDQTDASRLFPNGSDDMETVDNVPVGIRIDEEKYVVSGVPEFVSVSLEGSKGTLTPLVKQKNFDVFVDLEGLDPGEHTVEIQYANVPSEVSIYIEPKTIEVTIEERASKDFQVNVDFINMDKLPEGYELGDAQVNPQKVTIVSSRDIIDQIAMVKVFVDVEGLTEPINNREVPVNVYDNQGNKLRVNVEPESVTVSVDVDNPSKTVPVSVSTTGDLPDGYSLSAMEPEVKEVEIFATSDVLKGIKEIKTEEIDLSTIKESKTIEAALSLPKGVQIRDAGKIPVGVELKQEKTINDVQINVENLGEGQDVSFVEPDQPIMRITVSGDDKDVKDLAEDDFLLVVDAQGLGAGEYNVPVDISAPENVEVSGEYEQVTIEIK